MQCEKNNELSQYLLDKNCTQYFENGSSYLLHANAAFADSVLQPVHADSMQGQVEGQLGLRQNNGQSTCVLIPLQLAIEDKRHDDDALLCQDEKLHIHGATLCASKDLPVERVISQKGDFSIAQEHQLVTLWNPDVVHARAQDVVPVGKGGGQKRAFSVHGDLLLRHGRGLRRTARRHQTNQDSPDTELEFTAKPNKNNPCC